MLPDAAKGEEENSGSVSSDVASFMVLVLLFWREWVRAEPVRTKGEASVTARSPLKWMASASAVCST